MVLARVRQATAHRSAILGRHGCAPGATSFIEQLGAVWLVAQQGKVTLLLSASCSSDDRPQLAPTLPHARGKVGTCCRKVHWGVWAITAVSHVSSHGSWRGRALGDCDGGHRGCLWAHGWGSSGAGCAGTGSHACGVGGHPVPRPVSELLAPGLLFPVAMKPRPRTALVPDGCSQGHPLNHSPGAGKCVPE